MFTDYIAGFHRWFAIEPGVVDSYDDRLWLNAVADLDMVLRVVAEPCNCSCGQHGCVATKGAWR
jgi:hypothetical protein